MINFSSSAEILFSIWRLKERRVESFFPVKESNSKTWILNISAIAAAVDFNDDGGGIVDEEMCNIKYAFKFLFFRRRRVAKRNFYAFTCNSFLPKSFSLFAWLCPPLLCSLLAVRTENSNDGFFLAQNNLILFHAPFALSLADSHFLKILFSKGQEPDAFHHREIRSNITFAHFLLENLSIHCYFTIQFSG